jgi:hypothetical protein
MAVLKVAISHDDGDGDGDGDDDDDASHDKHTEDSCIEGGQGSTRCSPRLE